MNLKVAVHNFVSVEESSPARAAGRLEQGRDLAFACLSTNRWVTPQTTIDSSVFALSRDRLYQYRFTPPPLATARGPISIPEWGQTVNTDGSDHFRIQELQEFESTDFQISPMEWRIGVAGPSRPIKHVLGGSLSVYDPSKRPRLEACSLRDLIPQSHFIGFPAAKFRPVDTNKIPPYEKTSPSPIAPCGTVEVDRLLRSRFRRAAWLIPVRGSLPWDSASKAVILEETQAASRSPSPCLQVPAAQPRVIIWTPNSLQHFWTFLESIRQAKHLGPLSLSFHAVSVDASPRDSVSEPVWESNHPYYDQLSSKLAAGSPDDFAADICKAHLENIDHIKVFHDAPYCLSLRNTLDAYRYEPVNAEVPGRSGANDRKIRTLKGAHLVLLDERSKPMFWM